jgi:chorismate mutase
VTTPTTTPTDPAAATTVGGTGSLESLPPSADITALRQEIDQLDADILRLIQRRTEVSQQIGAIRRAEGGPRIVLSREQAVLARFRDLGPEGRELGMMLLRLGRGRLGRA